MALVTTPAKPYALAEWLKKPRNAKDDEGFDKYSYKDGESLLSIAGRVSKPWKTVTWQDLTNFNWGTSKPTEVNYYLREHTGCKHEDKSGNNYCFASDDTNPFIWVPKLEKPVPPSKYRSPSKIDVGHVALDDESGKHINTLVIRPVYAISLELGDIDALFEPMGGGDPHKSRGIQQRLQVLGYFYTPLGHTKRDTYCKKVWEYYRKVHTKSGKPAPNNAELKAILKLEVQNNLIARNFPGSGVVLDEGRLPKPGRPEIPATDGKEKVEATPDEFAAIRLPGGYCYTKPHIGADLKSDDPNDAKYGFGLGDGDRFELEEMLYKDNALLGKIPLVAKVEKVLPTGKREPAEGVSVYFQLVKPYELKDGNPFKAHNLRTTEMDYSKDRKFGDLLFDNGSVNTPLGWAAVKPILLGAKAIEDPGDRDAYIQSEVDKHPADKRAVLRSDVDTWLPSVLNNIPYEMEDTGPDKFVKDAYKNNPPADKDGPQAHNAPTKFGGKRDLPVEGEGSGADFKPGVFEVGLTRQGLHSKRDDLHADYGDMTAAQKVEPRTETDEAGKEVVKHAHAVRAKTNEKGYAGVIFMPSRIGGDTYKLRAYVGPETLEYAGDEPDGPAIDTGTMVVWRNIRLHRYARLEIPPKGNATGDGALSALWTNSTTGVNTVDKMWTAFSIGDGLGTIDSDATMKANLRDNPPSGSSNHLKYYRPVDVDVVSLTEQFNRCYCEFIKDCTQYPEPLAADEIRAAINAGITAAIASGEVDKVVDWNSFILTSGNSPVLLDVRHWQHYNTLIAAGPAPAPPALVAADVAKIRNAVRNHLIYVMMEHFSGGGVLPGLTIVQAARGDNWSSVGNAGSNIFTSGIGLPSRGCMLFYTNSTYAAQTFCYNLTGNTAHELGHVLLRQHQPPDPGGDGHQTQTGRGVAPTADSCVCVMSYRGCYGEYCGRCVLALRGWHTKLTGYPNGV